MLLIPLFAAVPFAGQGPDGGPPPVPPPPPASRATAVLAVRPPVIDGRDDDDVWRQAGAITEFREWQPVEDGPARFPTMAKVAYDARALYVFVRCFDPHPDSLIKLLARRDAWPPSDRVIVVIDSYHDKRTGYEFGVTAAGVKFDASVSNDGNENDAWDGVWDAATTVDSLGWTAEFRIPLSQLRYPRTATHTFGLAISRDIYRYTERVAWPVFHVSRAGLSSQLGDLTGLDGLGSPRRLEVTPYSVTKNVSVPTATGFSRDQQATAGADFKYGVTSNLTVDGTINPDFGQVEADPSVLNLSAFESFFQERRPFFIEGSGIFRFDVDCSAVNCNGEGLFYSRRIGRRPQLGGLYGDPGSPTASRILVAGKRTGRLAGGAAGGRRQRGAPRAAGRAGPTIEPRTNYPGGRRPHGPRGGQTGVGVLFTGVNRGLDAASAPFLRRGGDGGAGGGRARLPRRGHQGGGANGRGRGAG